LRASHKIEGDIMKRPFELILLILIGFIALSCHGCHTEMTTETPKYSTPHCIPISPDTIYWCETEEWFYTTDLARAQDRVPFPIVLPSYIPAKGKGIPRPSISGPLITGSDNETEISISYSIDLGDETEHSIFIIESNYPHAHYSMGDPESDPNLELIEIGGKQVVKSEPADPSGSVFLFDFNSESIYFTVGLCNFPADEAMKIVESIVKQTAGWTPHVEAEIVLEPDILSDNLSPEDTIADTIVKIEARLNALGLTGTTVKKEGGNLIVVQLPKVEDIEQVVTLVTSRAELDFRELMVDANGRPVLDEEDKEQWVIAKAQGSDGQESELTDKYLKPNAYVDFQPRTNEPEVAFEWNPEGAILFEQITQRNLKKPLGIFLDDALISAPTVQAVIKDRGVITGLNLDEAKMLAIQLNSGAYPIGLRVVRITSIGKD
jgi:hypothetical protein